MQIIHPLHACSHKIVRGGGWLAKRRRPKPARGVRGHFPPPPPWKIFENLMQNGVFWGNLEKKIAVYKLQNYGVIDVEFNSAYWFRTPSLIVLVGFQGGGGGFVRTPQTPNPPPGYGYALLLFGVIYWLLTKDFRWFDWFRKW